MKTYKGRSKGALELRPVENHLYLKQSADSMYPENNHYQYCHHNHDCHQCKQTHWVRQEDIGINRQEEVSKRKSRQLQSFLTQTNDVLKPECYGHHCHHHHQHHHRHHHQHHHHHRQIVIIFTNAVIDGSFCRSVIEEGGTIKW